MTTNRWTWLGLAATFAAGCSADDGSLGTGGPTGDPPAEKARAGEIRGKDTWSDGTTLTGTVSIAPGAVVEIAPGAKITVAEGASILVGGELRARASSSPAKLTSAAWGGLVVAKGGKIDLEGVTLENPRAAITATEGALASRFAKGAIAVSLNPFTIGKGANLTVDDVKVTTPPKPGPTEVSESTIRGTMTATRLDYDAEVSEGLSVRDGGELVIEDSTLHGSGGLDMVSAYDGKRLVLRYTLLKGAHCGPHLQGLDSFEIDHVTSEENTFGITIYKSGAGPNVVKDSNFRGGAAWIDFQGTNGPITMQNVFVSGTEILKGDTAPPTITKAAAPIANARPR